MYIIKKRETLTDNPPIRKYDRKKCTFKIKTGFLRHEMMKLLGVTKSKITKNKYVENVSLLKIIEVVLVHCNIVSNDY